MIFPALAPAGALVPLEGSLSRALDVTRGLALLLPSERLAAVSMLHQLARDRFGPETAESSLAREAHHILETSAGATVPAAQLQNLERAWQALLSAEGGVDPEDGMRSKLIVRGPLFEAGPVRFFQSPYVRSPLVAGQVHAGGTVGGGYLFSNEPHFSSYFDHLHGTGGVAFGLGSLQNLDLALAADSSALIIADITTTVTMTLALLLPQLALSRSRHEFANAALELSHREGNKTAFLDPLPERFRPNFEAHIDELRGSASYPKQLRRLVNFSLDHADSFLGDDALFERAANMVRRGGVSLIYGDAFREEMPDLLSAALNVYGEPLRLAHVTNAPEQVIQRNYPVSAEGLLRILEEHMDGEGKFLMSTEFSPAIEVKRSKVEANDVFTYHLTPGPETSAMLRAYGHLAPFVRRYERTGGITLRPRNASTP